MRKQITTTQYIQRAILRKKIIITILCILLFVCMYFFYTHYLKKELTISSGTKNFKSALKTNINNNAINNITNTEYSKEITQSNTKNQNTSNSKNLTSSSINTNESIGTSISTSLNRYEEIEKDFTKKDEKNTKNNVIETNTINNVTTNTTIRPTPSAEEIENNKKISAIKELEKELSQAKFEYENAKNEIELWYQEEVNKTNEEMLEYEEKYNDLGGKATLEDLQKAIEKLNYTKEDLASKGLLDSGNGIKEIEKLEDEISILKARISYTNSYNTCYNYIHTKLSGQKSSKLLTLSQEYYKLINEINNKFDNI